MSGVIFRFSIKRNIQNSRNRNSSIGLLAMVTGSEAASDKQMDIPGLPERLQLSTSLPGSIASSEKL